MSDPQSIKQNSQDRMHKSIEALKAEFVKIRTGRAHTSLLDHIMVNSYGAHMPLNQVANITVLDPRTLGVTPWDKSMLNAVDKAIRESDLGLNPTNVGTFLRIPLPAMTEERRKDLVKVVRHEAETARVAIRNIRRDANHELKVLLKDKKITEDEDKRFQDVIQKMTDKHIAEVETVLSTKEAELMEV
jgi:ribosome recycling factor